MAAILFEEIRVKASQHTSANCFICGVDNTSGLKARFYELENGEAAALFTVPESHNGYPGRVHGGVTGALLDETVGRAINNSEPESWGVTVELNVRYLKPIPTETPLKARGRIEKNKGRSFTGSGELYLPDGTVAATCVGTYVKLPIERIAAETGTDHHSLTEAGWIKREFPDDPEVISFPRRQDS
jgi:uncharacterized protein (TIGR00369 family)